jgi:hypothetical protein
MTSANQKKAWAHPSPREQINIGLGGKNPTVQAVARSWEEYFILYFSKSFATDYSRFESCTVCG